MWHHKINHLLGQTAFPLWVHYSTMFSEVLLVSNAAVNLAIYAATSAPFRRTLSSAVAGAMDRMGGFCSGRVCSSRRVCHRGAGGAETDTTSA